MSNFVKAVPFTAEFEGDTVQMSLSALKRKDMLILAPFMPDGEGEVGAMDSMQMLDAAAKILPEHVSSFTGLRDRDGAALAFEDIVDEMYFMDLISTIFTRIFDISNMGKKEAKNSQGQPVMSISEPVTSEATG